MAVTVCAVVDPNTGKVVNTIMADAVTDKPIPGFLLVAIPKNYPVDSTCTWNVNQLQFVSATATPILSPATPDIVTASVAVNPI